jgi:hypothetical protein
VKNRMNVTKSDSVPFVGTIVGWTLERLGKFSLSDAVMLATLVFTICKIVPAAVHAWNVIRRFWAENFGKDKKE